MWSFPSRDRWRQLGGRLLLAGFLVVLCLRLIVWLVFEEGEMDDEL